VGAEDGFDAGLVAFAVLFDLLHEHPTGAEAPFLLCAPYAALEAPLFHGRAGGACAFNSKARATSRAADRSVRSTLAVVVPGEQRVPPLRIAFLPKATLRSK
jgi:hypothetical protein